MNVQSAAFVCIFEIGLSDEAEFKIVQTNQFKASDHLKLRFKKGNDQSIKKYLSQKLKTAMTGLGEFQERSI